MREIIQYVETKHGKELFGLSLRLASEAPVKE
jgi:hypothetical protein